MIKKYSLILIAFLCFSLSGYGQVSEGFETGLPATYGATTTYNLASGTWTGSANQVIANTNPANIQSGIRSLQLKSQSGSEVTSPNIATGGLGDITFYSRSSTASGSVQVSYRINGGSWISATGSPFSITSSLIQYTATVNSSANNIQFQFKRISSTIYIDDVNSTTFSSCTDLVDSANIQFPNTTQTKTGNAPFDVYARAEEPGVTDTPNNHGAGISAWIGFNTIGANHPPSLAASWTWIPATYNDTGGIYDEYVADIGTATALSRTYYYASRFELNGCDPVYGGSGGVWNNDSVQLNVLADQVDFCNVDFPKTATITVGDNHTVYAQAYEPGVTDAVGQGSNLQAWIGYNTIGINYHPDETTGWTWVLATYNPSCLDCNGIQNDEYYAEIGSALPVGTYYYASRFRLNGSDYSYGGIDSDNTGNFWDENEVMGITPNSGVLTITNAPCSDLIISEYVEGSSFNKYIEIFNGTGGTVNLSAYEIQIFNNGAATYTATLTLSGTIADGATKVYRDVNASPTLYTGASTPFPSVSMSFNGDDAIALLHNSTIIDVIGQIGFDPGSAWTGGSSSTLNRTLRRKSTVQVGDADGSNVFAPNLEWDAYPIDSVDDLGYHFSSCHPDREIQLNINSTNVACGYTYNYGNQIIDTNNDVVLTIQNLGDLPLQITGLNLATGTQYSLVGAPVLPFTIPPTSSQNITIRFNPSALGVFLDTLTVASNDASESSCDINLTGISASNCSTTTTVFAEQDFESLPTDTWSYTANHAPISSYWDVMSSLPNIASAQSGSNFWGITDLDRSGHHNQTHELSFSQSLVGFTNVQLAFHYYTINIDASDSFDYELIFDGVSQGVNDISADTGAWTEILVNIPDSVNAFEIIFYAAIDASNDNAGIDNLSLSSTTINTVTWDGTNWDWNDGTPQNTLPNSSSAVVLNAPFTTTAAGRQQSFTSCSLTINNVLLTINDGHSIEVENSLIVNGTNGGINIEPQGSFVQVNDMGTVTATTPTKLTVSKLTAPANNWYEYTYWSSPVYQETPGNFFSIAHPWRRYQYNAQNYRDSTYETANDDSTTPGAGVDDVDDNGDDWQAISTPFLLPGVGYASMHDPTIFASTPGCPGPTCGIRYTFSGLFNNGVITVPLYRNDSELGDINWNFVGNPYPSAISADAFLNTNMGIVDENIPEPYPIVGGAIYLWSQNTPPSNTTNGNQNLNFSDSDYAIINGTGQTAAQTNGGDATVPSRYIPSGQGFFISMDNAATATLVSPTPVPGNIIRTTDLIFNNAMRVTGNNNQFFRSATQQSSINKLWVNLSTDNGVFSQVLIGYLDNATDDYDGMYFDAPRNAATSAHATMYTLIPGLDKKLAIQGKNSNSLTTDEVIPLGFYTKIDEATIYTLSIAQLEGEFMTSNAIYVKDKQNNTIHNLKDSDYTFTSETGEFKSRFEIVFRADALSIDDNLIDANGLTITELPSGEVQIKVDKNLTITNVKILDILGRQIYNLKGNSSTEIYNLSHLSKAPYIAKITLSNGQVINKKAIKQR